MTWPKIIKKLKTIWSKGKFYISATAGLMIALCLILVFKRRGGERWKVFDKAEERHKKELETIEKSHQEHLEKHKKELELYNETVEKIEEQKRKKNEELSLKQKKIAKKIIKKYKDEPEKLTERLSIEFGIEQK